MSGAVAALMISGTSPFPPVTRTYDVGVAATETVPTGARQVVMQVWGRGGQGGGTTTTDPTKGGGGGGSGAYALKTITVAPGDWGKTFTYTVGGPSTVVNGTFSVATNISCSGGGNGTNGTLSTPGTGGAGGTATGGDINTIGLFGTDGDLGSAGAGAPNGGGDSPGVGTTPGGGGSGRNGTVSGSGFAGAAGRIRFSYT